MSLLAADPSVPPRERTSARRILIVVLAVVLALGAAVVVLLFSQSRSVPSFPSLEETPRPGAARNRRLPRRR